MVYTSLAKIAYLHNYSSLHLLQLIGNQSITYEMS